MTLPRQAVRRPWAIVATLGAATVPVTAWATGEGLPSDPASMGVGAVSMAAIGGLVVAIRALASRGQNGGTPAPAPAPAPAQSSTDAEQSVSLAKLGVRVDHLATQGGRHDAAIAALTAGQADQLRALDRVEARAVAVDERLRELVAEVRGLLNEQRTGRGPGADG